MWPFRRTDINKKVQECHDTPNARLIDVRTPQEYKEGHIPESLNIPLDDLGRIRKKVKDRNTPLYVYCFSGARSRQATGQLEAMGYTRVTNIGGYRQYKRKEL